MIRSRVAPYILGKESPRPGTFNWAANRKPPKSGTSSFFSTATTIPQADILARCEELNNEFIQPLNDKLRGPLDKGSSGGYKTTKLPFVFLLGNHSSGKSSFINYCMGRNIQTAGVAPTDDSFTIIAPGPGDIDQDGPALIGDPDMGFAGLRQFGPALIHHTCLKVRKDILTSSFMMVDSPGMIDSPVSRQSVFELSGQLSTSSSAANLMDRGYNFEGVVRWFAERADVILLFFDPDKPGTTGETLSILTNSLPGMDHKLHIILNKADKFEKIHDFARAYGSLCWNLSKVIPRKDLPRIYTMCLPILPTDPAAAGARTLGTGLQDLEATRADVVAEVFKAPKRRIDNVITRLTDSVHLLQVHATILESLRSDYSKARWGVRGTTTAIGLIGGGVSTLAWYSSLAPPEICGAAAGVTLLVAGAAHSLGASNLKKKEEHMLSVEGLNRYFSKCYARELAEGDEFISSVWRRIRDGLKLSLGTTGLGSMAVARASEIRELQRILEEEVPALRRVAAPAQYYTDAHRQLDSGK